MAGGITVFEPALRWSNVSDEKGSSFMEEGLGNGENTQGSKDGSANDKRIRWIKDVVCGANYDNNTVLIRHL